MRPRAPVSQRWLVVPVIALVVAVGQRATPARAEAEGGGDPAAESEALIRQGLELREKSEDEAALRLFQRAFAISHGGRALAQVAFAEQALGRWIDAEKHLREALGHRDEAWIVEKRAVLEQALGDLREHLGSLELTGGVAGAEVRINGQVAGTLPLADPLRVAAGSVALELRAPGYLPILRTVLVPARGLAREEVVFVVARAEPPPGPDNHHDVVIDRPPPATGGLSARKTGAIALGAVAVGALATGVVFHLVRESRAQGFNDASCVYANGRVSGPSGCQGRYDDVQTARNIAIGGYVAAGVLGGASVVLFLTGNGSAGASSPPHASVQCAPGLDRTFACFGRF